MQQPIFPQILKWMVYHLPNNLWAISEILLPSWAGLTPFENGIGFAVCWHFHLYCLISFFPPQKASLYCKLSLDSQQKSSCQHEEPAQFPCEWHWTCNIGIFHLCHLIFFSFPERTFRYVYWCHVSAQQHMAHFSSINSRYWSPVFKFQPMPFIMIWLLHHESKCWLSLQVLLQRHVWFGFSL